GHQELVTDGLAHRVEEPCAAMDMAPALEMDAARVAADEEVVAPFLVGEGGRIGGPRDMRLAAIGEFEFGQVLLAVGAMDQEHGRGSSVLGSRGSHQCATAAAAASSISRPVVNRSSVKGALIGCGSSLAIVQASVCAAPGVALNPPVPQPQLT